MKGFFEYNNNEEQKIGSSKIIVGKPANGDKFVLVRDQFDLKAGTIVTITEDEGVTHKVGFGLSKVNLKTSNGIITLEGSTKLIQECFDEYVPVSEVKQEPKTIVVNKTIQQKIIEQGLPGERGERGERGIIGPVGEQGPKGEKGERGERGEQGSVGERGEQGPVGERGEQGLRGERGEKGDKGDQGLPGKNGIDGKDGLPGPTGSKGERGEPGPEGKPGPAGATGLKGDKGDKGDRGDQGEQGPAGRDGKQGKQGLKGTKGDKGDKGDPGDSGIVSANYPLVYDAKSKSLSFDSTKLEKLINTLGSSKGTFDLTSLGGGAVGIQYNKAQIIKSVNDINFTGAGVTVTRKGKNVEVNIPGATGSGGSGSSITGPYVSYLNGLTGAVSIAFGQGITGNIVGNTVKLAINYNYGGETFPIYAGASLAGVDYLLAQRRGATASEGYEMYRLNISNMFAKFAPTVKSTRGTIAFAETNPDFLGQGLDLGADTSLKFNIDTDLSLQTPGSLKIGNLYGGSYLELNNSSYLKFTDGTTQGTAANIFTEGITAPTSPIAGDRWFKVDEGILYTAITGVSGSIWVEL